MARKSLDDVLGSDEGDEAPAPSSSPAQTADTVPDTYKLTVVLSEEEHETLEALVDLVLAEVRPRRVGKGWRAKTVRMMLEVVADDQALKYRIADRLKWREHNVPRDDPSRRRPRRQ